MPERAFGCAYWWVWACEHSIVGKLFWAPSVVKTAPMYSAWQDLTCVCRRTGRIFEQRLLGRLPKMHSGALQRRFVADLFGLRLWPLQFHSRDERR